LSAVTKDALTRLQETQPDHNRTRHSSRIISNHRDNKAYGLL
jgi:hypothetical protein